jgi:hypothetical protein
LLQQNFSFVRCSASDDSSVTADTPLSLISSPFKTAPLLTKGGAIVATTSFLNEVGTSGLSILRNEAVS